MALARHQRRSSFCRRKSCPHHKNGLFNRPTFTNRIIAGGWRRRIPHIHPSRPGPDAGILCRPRSFVSGAPRAAVHSQNFVSSPSGPHPQPSPAVSRTAVSFTPPIQIHQKIPFFESLEPGQLHSTLRHSLVSTATYSSHRRFPAKTGRRSATYPP